MCPQPVGVAETIEPDVLPDQSDAWSDLDAGVEIQSLVSLTSSITGHIYKNGRRYAGSREARYPLPNDEAECDRHDLLHHIYGILFGGELVFSKFKTESPRILDLGAGTGIWAMDVADLYPNGQVIGVDISPTQPSWVPPNLEFQIDNIENEWTFSKDSFDLIHFQNLNGSIFDWPKLFSQIYDHIKPGGWLEIKESNPITRTDTGTIPETSYLRTWEAECSKASNLIGFNMTVYKDLKGWAEAAGFVDVELRTFKLPLGTWPKDPTLKKLGTYQMMQYMDALQPYALGLLVEVLKWSKEHVEVFLAKLREDLKRTSFHAYYDIYVMTARKPEST